MIAAPPLSLWKGDNLDILPTLPEGSVQLVLTSPPYNVGYDYADGGASDSLPLHEYLDRLARTILHLQLVLREGGVLALNVPQTIRTPRHRAYPLAATIATAILQPQGWLLREPAIWAKSSDSRSVAAQSTAIGGPSNPYLRPVHEVVLLASKGTYTVPNRGPGWELDGYLDATKDVWLLPHGKGGRGRPLAFPPDLVSRLVCLFSAPGDVVLDPWAGSGTTAKVARMLGREAWLIERQEAYWLDLEAIAQVPLPEVAS